MRSRTDLGIRSRRGGMAAGSHVAGPVPVHGTPVPLAEAPNIPPGTGPVRNGTSLKFSISDRLSLQVNVGSGDALLRSTDITIPEIGSSLTLGTSYNSLLVGSDVPAGSNGYGWRSREGADVQLVPADDGSVTYLGEDGTAGDFTQDGSTMYNSPGQFHVTLEKKQSSECEVTGIVWSMTWHATGEQMCFNASGLLARETDRNDNTTAYAYNGSGQETQITFTPHGDSSPTRTVNASYTGSYLTGFSQATASTTKTVSYGVNATTGNLDSLTQADGTKIKFGYDSSHDLTSITNGDNVATTLAYNSSHQVTSVTQPTATGPATTRLDYTSSTQTLVADPNTDQSSPVTSVPNVTYTIDDSSSLVTNVEDQQGNNRSTSYTPFNDVATYQNGVGGKTTSTYGANNGESLTQTVSPTGATSSLAYGNSNTTSNPTASFQPKSSKDAQANTTLYSYDGAGNLSDTQDASAAKAEVTYNSDGTPENSTDPMNDSAGNSTAYGYTSHQLTTITPPAGNSLKPETLTYDGYGRVKSITDGNGDTVTYGYDLADRVTRAAYTGGANPVTVTYKYDGAGNLKTQTDPSGTISYGYDPRNLVTSRTATSGGGTLAYGYDLDANLTSATDAGGKTSYVYDDRNLLTQMNDPAGNQWYFQYDADGRRTLTYFNTNSTQSTWAGRERTYYDNSGRITQLKADENSSFSNEVQDISYCYNTSMSGGSCSTTPGSDTNLVQYATDNNTGTVSQYSYKDNRLTKATNINGQTYDYEHDSDGNITSGAAAGGLSYNSANQITTGGYSYDGAGNLTHDPASATLSYNDAGQMTAASNAGGHGQETFTYAGANQDQLLSDGSATGITYGLANQYGQPWVQSYTPAQSTSPIYVLHDQQGTPLGYIQNGKDYAYVSDNLGSVTAIIGPAGTIIRTFSYDPYGNATSTGSGANRNQIGYTGALTDPAYSGIAATGWTHLGQRWQNPGTGSFTSQDANSYLADPANGNRYAYAADNPTNYTDPTGQCSVLSGAGTGAVIGTAVGGVGGALVGGLVTGGIGAVPGFFLGAGQGATLGTFIGGAVCGLENLF